MQANVTLTEQNGQLLNREIFTTLIEVRILIEQWRREYNQIRPHSWSGYRPPAPEVKNAGNSNLESGTITWGKSRQHNCLVFKAEYIFRILSCYWN